MTPSERSPARPLYERIFPLGIPLAWRQLTAEKKRFATAVAGITFAVAMMLFQMGLNSALFDQVVAPLLQMHADVVLISPQFQYLGTSSDFPRARLVSALAEGESMSSLYLGSLPFKNPLTGREREIFILGIDPAETAFSNLKIISQQQKLKREGVMLFDELSRSDYGPIAKLLKEDNGVVDTEISGRHAQIEGLFSMGPTFAADGNVLMNRDDFLKIWPKGRADQISVGLLNLKSGADAAAVVAALQARLPPDVEVLTFSQFVEKEKTYWSARTPIGFVIGASMAVSLIVGAVIVYQILYTDVTDHLPEYATLKSIGFTDGYFVRLVLQESIILSLLGFFPGTGLAAILYWLTREVGHMPTHLYLVNVVIVFGLSLFMCLVAGLIAMRKLRQANPADIF